MKKRPFLLLEVLIAFVLVLLCIFPLVSSHVYILKAQSQFNKKIGYDQAVTSFYTYLLERVYTNAIPWTTFEKKEIQPINWKSVGIESEFPLEGSYQFEIVRSKGTKDKPFSAHVIRLTITINPEEATSPFIYEYQFFAVRDKEEHEQK